MMDVSIDSGVNWLARESPLVNPHSLRALIWARKDISSKQQFDLKSCLWKGLTVRGKLWGLESNRPVSQCRKEVHTCLDGLVGASSILWNSRPETLHKVFTRIIKFLFMFFFIPTPFSITRVYSWHVRHVWAVKSANTCLRTDPGPVIWTGQNNTWAVMWGYVTLLITTIAGLHFQYCTGK